MIHLELRSIENSEAHRGVIDVITYESFKHAMLPLIGKTKTTEITIPLERKLPIGTKETRI